MTRYHCKGVMRATGGDVETDVFATDPDQAVGICNARGILPSPIIPVPDPDPGDNDQARGEMVAIGRAMLRQMRFLQRVAIVAAGALTLVLLAGMIWGGNVARTKWEYTFVAVGDRTFEDDMAEIGGNGWEVASARRAIDYGDQSCYEMILKRPAR